MCALEVAFDYKAEFADAVTDLITEDITDRTERMSAVHALIEAYVDSVGITPDAAQLERLTDYILREELTDTHPDKMTREEYPIMSVHQEERRRDNEYEDVLAESYDVAGKNHAKPERRVRTAREHRFVDKLARQKNRARNAQYKRDTTAGPVIAGASESFTQNRGLGAKWRAMIEREEIVRGTETIDYVAA